MIQVYLPGHYPEIEMSHPDFDIRMLQQEKPGSHIMDIYEGKIITCCSVWWLGTPEDRDERVGTIGHFYGEDSESAKQILKTACALLAEKGCKRVVAPMNGNTWRDYRYAVLGMDRRPFLMEPEPAYKRDVFLREYGFSICEEYGSFIGELEKDFIDLEKMDETIRIRALDLDKWDETMEKIYDLSVQCFFQNPYYTSLPKEEFLKQYGAYKEMVEPNMILLAYDRKKPVGFLFCMPDYNERFTGSVKTMIFKTIGVLPTYQRKHVGRMLVNQAKRNALKAGYTTAITALIHMDNHSKKLCEGDTLLRQYVLYGKKI